MGLRCPKCGNTKKFYREVSVSAKLRVDGNGNDLRTVHDEVLKLLKNNFNNEIKEIAQRI